MIDDEVRILVDTSYKRVKQLLQDKFDAVKIIAEELLKKEVLFKDDLEVLIGKRPFQEDSEAPKEVSEIAQVTATPTLVAEETAPTTTEA